MKPVPESPKPQITFGKFENVDMRVARVVSAELAVGTRFPCRILELDVGPIGRRVSVGQYALVPEDQLLGINVVACINLGARKLGDYESEALVLGVPHPDSPAEQAQALPLLADAGAEPGAAIF